MSHRKFRKGSGSYILLPSNGDDRMTLDELLERLKEYDIDDLIELLKITSEDLVEILEWDIKERYDELVKEIGEVDTPWDDYYD